MVSEVATPPYLYRDYKLDTPKTESKVLRFAMLILPFFALYSPFGTVLSVSLGSMRCICTLHKAYTAYEEENYLQMSAKLTLTVLATISVVNCFFQFRSALLLTASFEVLENFQICLSSLLLGQTGEAFFSFSSAINSSAYLKMLSDPTVATILFSLTTQILFELIGAVREFKKGKDRYFEGFAKIMMASIRSYQALPYLEVTLAVHGDKIVNFINKQKTAMASILHKFSAYMAIPRVWYSSKLIRLFTVIDPSKSEQCDSKAGEIAVRAFYGLLVIPMFFLSLGVSICSELSRITASLIQPESYFLLEGNPAAQKKEIDKELIVMQENACCVEYSEAFGGVPPWRKRVNTIIQEIKDTNPDVVCLQEVNDLNAAHAIFQGVKDSFFIAVINIGSKEHMLMPFKNNSGLMVLSKYAIKDLHFIPFNVGTGSQAMVNKGLFSLALHCNDQVFAHILPTHFPPSKKDFFPTSEEKQNKRIAQEILIKEVKRLQLQSEDTYKIIVGDMNIPWGTEEWKDSFLASSDFFDPYNYNRKKVTPQEATCATDDLIKSYFGKKDPSWLQHPMIVDYALVTAESDPEQKSRVRLISSFGTDSEKEPSDHKATVLTFPMIK